jgi:anaerobic magnesium-protoporphyrin IX monomethyl ester cyclase
VILGEAEETPISPPGGPTILMPISTGSGLAIAARCRADVDSPHTRPALDRDLDALPFPAWDLIDVERYRVAWTAAHGRLSWNVCTSRGCPYACNWCAKPVFGRRYTQRTAANVAEELAQLRRAVAPDHVWFADDIFGITPRWIEAFAAAVRSRGAAVPFSMQSRVNLMTPSAVEALAEARCEEVWMGVESGAQHVLDAMEKGTTLDEVREGTHLLKQHGIRACWFVQLGYPGEDWSAILQTRDLIRAEKPDDIGVSVAYPLPGTPFYDRVRMDLRGKANWSDSDDLAMLFQGAYSTDFYREIRDLLHAEVNARTGGAQGTREFDARWTDLERREADHRSTEDIPVKRAVGLRSIRTGLPQCSQRPPRAATLHSHARCPTWPSRRRPLCCRSAWRNCSFGAQSPPPAATPSCRRVPHGP